MPILRTYIDYRDKCIFVEHARGYTNKKKKKQEHTHQLSERKYVADRVKKGSTKSISFPDEERCMKGKEKEN